MVTLLAGPYLDCYTGGVSTPGAPYNAPDLLSPAPGDLLSSSCFLLEVTDGTFAYLDPANPAPIPPRRVWVRQSHPPGPGSPVGSVVFGTGGFGQAVYSRSGANRLDTVVAARDAGYQTFELGWAGAHGFANGGEGAGWSELAGAFVEVVRHLLDQHATDPGAPLCAVGTSGGAQLIAYGMTSHGAESLFTQVVLAAGPPVVDVVDACFLQPFHPTAFPTSGGMSATHPGRPVMDATLGWGAAGSCVGRAPPPGADMNRARRDSLLSSGPDADLARDLSWTGVDVGLVWGDQDITGATVHGQAFEAALAKAGTLTRRRWVTGIPAGLAHDVDDTAIGAFAVQDLLLQHCR